MKQIFLLIILAFSFSISAFPYKIEWHLKSRIKKRYFPQKAWKDFEYFLLKFFNKNAKIGITLFQIDHPKTLYVFLDGTVEAKISSEININSGNFIDLTDLKKPRKIPLDNERRKKISSGYGLSGFIELEILDSGKITKEWTDISEKFLKRKDTYYYKLVVKIFDKKGSLLYFDFVNPQYIKEAYYRIEKENIDGISSETLVQIEVKEYFGYNSLKGKEKDIW